MSWFWKLFWVLEGGWLLPVSAPCCSSGEPQVRRFHLEAPGALSLHHLHQQRRTSTVEVQLSVRSWAFPGSRLGGASIRCRRTPRPPTSFCVQVAVASSGAPRFCCNSRLSSVREVQPDRVRHLRRLQPVC